MNPATTTEVPAATLERDPGSDLSEGADLESLLEAPAAGLEDREVGDITRAEQDMGGHKREEWRGSGQGLLDRDSLIPFLSLGIGHPDRVESKAGGERKIVVVD